MKCESILTCRETYAAIGEDQSYPVTDVRCVPCISRKSFFNASTDIDQQLFKFVGLSMMTVDELLAMIIVPNLKGQPEWLLDPLIQFVFGKVTFVGNDEMVQLLSTLEFVTVCDKKGQPSPKRLKCSEVIDQSNDLQNLYFDDEKVFGSGIYNATGANRQIMIHLGMKSHFDEDIARERIQAYSLHDPNKEGLFDKCGCLLTFLNRKMFEFKSEWLPLMRVPAMKLNERLVVHPSQCRPKSFTPLVEGVLGIVPIHVDKPLHKTLGWDADIDPETISSRIEVVVSCESSPNVQHALYPILVYLNNIACLKGDKIGDYITKLQSKLSSKAWLPGSTNGLWPPERLFFKDARAFEPYFSELPIMWSTNLVKILSLLNLASRPNSDQIAEFITTFATCDPLTETKMDAVILALQRLESEVTDFPKMLMVPDINGILLPIDEFFPKKGWVAGNSLRYAHPRVPSSLAFKLGIPQFKDDLAHAQMMNGADIFDEFVQEENIVNRIAKQVKESTLWLSLNEFVANAEDCGSASKVTWILDSTKCRYPLETIFCEELEEWQTPGIYAYNDGVFTDSDFGALVNIGMGSKSEDSSKIGKYGIGSLTMYLFTDLPSIISGEYFIIFDPARKYLPFDRNHRRRQAGLRVRLSQMKSKFVGHLLPFVGIGGYTVGKNHHILR